MAHVAITQHLQTVRDLAKPGQPLGQAAPTSTIRNPAWFANIDGEPIVTPLRRRVHQRLLEQSRAAAVEIRQESKAVVLAGPPGAGKGTVVTRVLGEKTPGFWMIDADEFKRAILREAQADGSYDNWIKPKTVRELEASGERFYPLELASLVHEESSILAQQARNLAIENGDNIVIDAVLSDERKALALGTKLAAADYDVRVIDVEVPFEVSEARIQSRWEQAYLAALNGEDIYGGRWVPSEYARDIYDGPDGQSRPEIAARALASHCPSVSRYQIFRTTVEQANQPGGEPTLDTDLSRAQAGEQLIETRPS